MGLTLFTHYTYSTHVVQDSVRLILLAFSSLATGWVRSVHIGGAVGSKISGIIDNPSMRESHHLSRQSRRLPRTNCACKTNAFLLQHNNIMIESAIIQAPSYSHRMFEFLSILVANRPHVCVNCTRPLVLVQGSRGRIEKER